MSELSKDTQLALAASKIIFDGRDPNDASVMVTLESVVSMVLLAHMRKDTRLAAAMLNEGLVPGVEQRIALAASRKI